MLPGNEKVLWVCLCAIELFGVHCSINAAIFFLPHPHLGIYDRLKSTFIINTN